STRDPVGSGGVPRVLREIRRMSTTVIHIKGE
ncbi:TPA: XF1762 family protein, partial [Escherichia coli]